VLRQASRGIARSPSSETTQRSAEKKEEHCILFDRYLLSSDPLFRASTSQSFLAQLASAMPSSGPADNFGPQTYGVPRLGAMSRRRENHNDLDSAPCDVSYLFSPVTTHLMSTGLISASAWSRPTRFITTSRGCGHMEGLFYAMFGVCFSCFAFRTAFNALQSRDGKFAEDRRLRAVASVVMFVLWFTWFYTVFGDPFGIHLPEAVRYMGLAVFVAGVLLVIATHVRIKGFRDERMLVTDGIYSKIRNPMYLGFILWLLGLPIFMQALFTLVSAGLWVPQILYWKYTEEKDLEKRYSEYADYKSRTWF